MKFNVKNWFSLEQFYKLLGKIKTTILSGEFIVGFVGFTIHIFIQIASVISKHMSVAFNIRPETTGIYFTKMFSLRGLVTLSASIFTYLIKLFIDEDNVAMTVLFWFLVFLSRFIFIVYLFISGNPALDIYTVFILDAVTVGLFQMTFYSFTAEHASVLSVCFKLSKITVFCLQMIMDFFFSEHPMTMVKIQFIFGFILTCISTGFWYYYCINKHNDKVLKPKKVKRDTIQSIQRLSLSEPKEMKEIENIMEDLECKKDIKEIQNDEPSFLQHLLNCMSPLFMCLIPLMMKNILYPSLLPYGLLERDKCHKINMVITPVGLVGSIIIHVMKKTITEINQRWKWYWHLLWLLVIPEIIIFVITFVALHTNSKISKLIINNQNVVFWMAVIFFFFHTSLESAGYMGVVANVKHCGKVMDRGKKMVSTNQLMSEITNFFFYKFAIGYNVTRKLYQSTIAYHPELEISCLERVSFWVRGIFRGAFIDFIKDFKMNIKEYI